MRLFITQMYVILPHPILGYFNEIILDKNVHHDGSVLCNNPTAIAVAEARRIWGRSVPIECIVSVGTGKVREEMKLDKASWLGIAQMVINSATDSKGTHRILQDLMPDNVYFRLNPFITEGYLNEYRSDKLTQYQKVHKPIFRYSSYCPRQVISKPWTPISIAKTVLPQEAHAFNAANEALLEQIAKVPYNFSPRRHSQLSQSLVPLPLLASILSDISRIIT